MPWESIHSLTIPTVFATRWVAWKSVQNNNKLKFQQPEQMGGRGWYLNSSIEVNGVSKSFDGIKTLNIRVFLIEFTVCLQLVPGLHHATLFVKYINQINPMMMMLMSTLNTLSYDLWIEIKYFLNTLRLEKHTSYIVRDLLMLSELNRSIWVLSAELPYLHPNFTSLWLVVDDKRMVLIT